MSENKKENNSLSSWIDKRLPVFTFINHNLRDYPTPKKFKLFLEFRVFGRYNPCHNDCHGYFVSYAVHS
jgi:hypothetical protein